MQEDRPPPGTRRWKVPAEARAVLENEFAINAFPTKEHREHLANQLNTTPRRVQIFFQNARQRQPKRKREDEGEEGETALGELLINATPSLSEILDENDADPPLAPPPTIAAAIPWHAASPLALPAQPTVAHAVPHLVAAHTIPEWLQTQLLSVYYMIWMHQAGIDLRVPPPPLSLAHRDEAAPTLTQELQTLSIATDSAT